MKILAKVTALICALLFGGAIGFSAQENKSEAKISSLRFSGVEYLHRWSKGDQHEFTPTEQADLERWSDMMTIIRYPSVTDGDALAATANAVLERYKSNRAMVLRTDSVPRTREKPAEYLVAVLFPRPDLIEAVFARFKIVDGIGRSVIYSHRKYGKNIGDDMSAWLKANGPSTEKTLMSWDGISTKDAPGK